MAEENSKISSISTGSKGHMRKPEISQLPRDASNMLTQNLHSQSNAREQHQPEQRQMTERSELSMEEEAVGPNSFIPLRLLGKGSFGEVYLVQKKNSPDIIYAMKVLSKKKIQHQNLVKYAMTERNVLSVTKHPFIVGLNFAFQTADKLFLLLDYCPGGDMGKVLL